MGVRIYDSLVLRGALTVGDEAVALTGEGEAVVASLGIEIGDLGPSRRPMCRACLDWSARRAHLAGLVGAAIYDRIQALGWAARSTDSRAVLFTSSGRVSFEKAFPL